jgi:AraC-like DNA-binding protein
MKQVLYDHLLSSTGDTFTLKESAQYHALNDFHYHPELELLYITEGKGVLLVGDDLIQANAGMLLLIGCNVPHMYKFDTHGYQNDLMKQGRVAQPLKLLTLHFDPAVLGDSFLRLQENSLIKELFTQALRGIILSPATSVMALALMQKLKTAPAYEHLYLLMQLLTIIAISDDKTFITRPAAKSNYNKTDEQRLTRVYLFTLDNFTRVLKLKEVADIVHMVPHAFCRYFKQRTNKSYFNFLMDVRISHACKLLKEKDYSVVVVCYESGFTNLSNFNRHFKLTTGKTPLEYRKQFHGN